MDTTPLALIILDGLALNPSEEANALALGKTPNLDRIRSQYPATTLQTHGRRVGLPEEQMGNSEVGHLNIGAGRVVLQSLSRIDIAVESQTIAEIPEFQLLCKSQSGSRSESAQYTALHMIGLLSSGGVHSSIEHFKSLLRSAVAEGVKQIYIHAISDGRDRPTQAAATEIAECADFISALQREAEDACKIELATLCGRYFAMDRDKRWDRVSRYYNLLTKREGTSFDSPGAALKSEYAAGRSDEFIEPVVFDTEDSEEASPARSSSIGDGDSLLFFNFRADRMREIVSCFLPGEDSCGFDRELRPELAAIVTLTEYDETFPCPVLFPPQEIKKHFGQVISEAGLRQLRIAETEKYPHVTYFFNGGEESPYPGEERVIVESRRDVATYDLAPEMSAEEVTARILDSIEKEAQDIYVINFANCDMVGHTGSLPAAIAAVEKVDDCLGRILEALLAKEGAALVTADHGNCDQMKDYSTGEAHTFHTTYPVPFVLVSDRPGVRLNDGGALCDIAPTALEYIRIAKPEEMTGVSRLESTQ